MLCLLMLMFQKDSSQVFEKYILYRAARLHASHNSRRSETSHSVSRTGQSLQFGKGAKPRTSKEAHARPVSQCPDDQTGTAASTRVKSPPCM